MEFAHHKLKIDLLKNSQFFLQHMEELVCVFCLNCYCWLLKVFWLLYIVWYDGVVFKLWFAPRSGFSLPLGSTAGSPATTSMAGRGTLRNARTPARGYLGYAPAGKSPLPSALVWH